MKTFYLYKANYNTTVFGFPSIEEAIQDVFLQGYTTQVEVYSYKAAHADVDSNKRKDIKLVVSAEEMKYIFEKIDKERSLQVKLLVKKHAAIKTP